jgi:hypothetical protein
MKNQTPLEAIQAEKIHLTLTLGEVDALYRAGQFAIGRKDSEADSYLVAALQKLDEAVNV